MSVFTFDVKEGNPVNKDTILALSEQLGVEEKSDTDINDYVKLLGVFHDSCEEIMKMDDYLPTVDYERFPRENIRFPTEEENRLGAWGWKCTIKDKNPESNNRLLEGSKVCVKDCVAIAGVPMLLGTNFITDYTPTTDATIITRLLIHGAVIEGKSVCENLCHSATSHSAGTGVVHNPLAIGYATGGSSSGTAGIVANEKESVDIGIGADQGGSVRIPSAWSGIYGMKPTFGLIPFTGCASNEATNDSLGIMTSTILSNAKGLQSVAGTDDMDDRGFGVVGKTYYENLLALENPKDLTGIKIGIVKEGFDNPAIEERVKKCCIETIKKFESLGATVEEVSIPLHSKGPLIWTGISKVGGYLTKMGCATGRRGTSLNDLNEKFVSSMHIKERWNEAYPSTKNIYYNGVYAVQNYPTLYGKCQNLSRKLKDDYNTELDKYDILVMPTVPFIARSHCKLEEALTPLDLLGKQVGLSSNTAPFNQTGHPALAMPCGMLPIQEGPLKDKGVSLPVSLQLIGKWYDEDTIYKIAYAFELSYDWKSL
ncbi:hypothetical protein C6P40_003444 [Pichia californica]|uniref:Amidase domain-containing protein n=1 Tax=Pichia californica TaxID=460514 RepID=A0A9P6WQT0_9ASCO|nr:hypothetical protein C6P42_002532 [[Candida] californica]KAG0690248.1 hypothetical protein C6P40_003444 [[Candida] californica]